MAVCKFCGVTFQWGQTEAGKWVPLMPLGEEGDVEREYQDVDGRLRAAHRKVCNFVGAVRIAKLARPVQAQDILVPPGVDPSSGEITGTKAPVRKMKSVRYVGAVDDGGFKFGMDPVTPVTFRFSTRQKAVGMYRTWKLKDETIASDAFQRWVASLSNGETVCTWRELDAQLQALSLKAEA